MSVTPLCSSLPAAPWLVFTHSLENLAVHAGGLLLQAAAQQRKIQIMLLSDATEETPAETLLSGTYQHLLRVSRAHMAQQVRQQLREQQPAFILAPSPLLAGVDEQCLGAVFQALEESAYANALWLFGTGGWHSDEVRVDVSSEAAEKCRRLEQAQLESDWVAARMSAYARNTQAEQAELLWAYPADKTFSASRLSGLLGARNRERLLALLAHTHSPPISVLVRTQNRPRLLAQALESLARQSYSLLQVVVVNDGGEEVEDVVAPYTTLFSHGLKLIQHEQAQGRSQALNVALEAADSDWLAFLDDDDVWENDGLATLAAYIPWDKDVIYGQVRVEDMEAGGQGATQLIGEPFDADRLLMVNSIPICAYICRRDKALQAGGFDPEFAVLEDWDFLIRLSRLAGFHYVPKIVSAYRVWGQAYITGKDADKEKLYRGKLYRKHAALLDADTLSRASLAFIDKYHKDLLALHQREQAQKQQDLQACRLDCDTRVHQNNLEHQSRHAEQAQAFQQLQHEHQTAVQELRDHYFREEQNWQQKLHNEEQRWQQKLHDEEQTWQQRLNSAKDDHKHYILQTKEQLNQLQAQVLSLQAQNADQAQVMSNVHDGWTRRMRQLIWRKAEGLVFIPESLLDLHKHGLSSPLRTFDGEQSETLIPELEGVRAPIPVLQGKALQWPFILRSDNAPTHMLLLQLGTYGRENHCHLHLQILSDEAKPRLCAEARLDARAIKDNKFTPLLLDRPLPNGRYLCRLTSPDSDNFQHAACLWLTVYYRHSGGHTMPHYHYREPAPVMPEGIASLAIQPLISVLVPVYNPPEQALRDCLDSVIAQHYPNWELCIADDASSAAHVRPLLQDYQARYPERIKLALREENGHIVAASNSALALAEGDYIALLDHDDLLTADALLEVVKLLNQYPGETVDLIYSDEDKIDETGEFDDPYFKPDWCPEILKGQMYLGHLGVYRRTLVAEVGGFRAGFEGSQDWDLALRVSERAERILHLPKILYHWRIHAESAASDLNQKPYAAEAGLKAVQEALDREGEGGAAELNDINLCLVSYPLPEPAPKISIVIPTRDMAGMLRRCLNALVERNRYPDWEIIIVDNGSEQADTFALFETFRERLGKEQFRVVEEPGEFNFSYLVNQGAAAAKGELILLLNNDTEVIGPDNWLAEMAGYALRKDIAGVGCKLLYEDGTLQHGGVITGIGGVAGHSHKYFSGQHYGYFSRLSLVSNYSALTAACLLVRKTLWHEVQGFSEDLPVAFNDVDFCLKLSSKGYRHVWLPQVSFYHYESKSRGHEDTPEKQRRFLREVTKMQQRWGDWVKRDPCYNPHLSHIHENFSLDENSPYYGDQEELM